MTFRLGTTYEDYKAPWENLGEDPDPEKTKRLVFNALTAEAEAKEKVKTVAAEKSEVDKALEAYKAAETAAAREKETEAERHARVEKELKEQLDAAKAGGGRETLLLKVALEKGLTEKQAGRLVGNTLEELQADADDYLKDVKKGDEPKLDDDGNPIEEPAGDDIELRTQPRVTRTAAQKRDQDEDVVAHVRGKTGISSLIA